MDNHVHEITHLGHCIFALHEMLAILFHFSIIQDTTGNPGKLLEMLKLVTGAFGCFSSSQSNNKRSQHKAVSEQSQLAMVSSGHSEAR